jgi:hypothetical protein
MKSISNFRCTKLCVFLLLSSFISFAQDEESKYDYEHVISDTSLILENSSNSSILLLSDTISNTFIIVIGDSAVNSIVVKITELDTVGNDICSILDIEKVAGSDFVVGSPKLIGSSDSLSQVVQTRYELGLNAVRKSWAVELGDIPVTISLVMNQSRLGVHLKEFQVDIESACKLIIK